MIPNEVMGMVIRDEMTPARAWREHFGFTGRGGQAGRDEPGSSVAA